MLASFRPAAVLVLCALALSACGFPGEHASPLPTPPTLPAGTLVPFEHIVDGIPGSECEPPELALLATTPEEYEQFFVQIPWDNGEAPSWQELNLHNEAVMAVWRGCGRWCEGGIAVEQIVQTEAHALSVYATFNMLAPSSPPRACPTGYASNITLVRFLWDGTPASETKIHLTVYPVYVYQ